MPDIFLSYASQDRDRTRLFAKALEAEGFSVWWDNAIRSGDSFDEAIEKALRGAKAVVVLWSPASVISRWVRAEATLADRNKTLVPCTIEACERPIMFELTQTAELAHWQGAADDAAWLAFVADVRRFVGGDGPAVAPPSRSAAGPVDTPLARETVLAVLPFDNLSSDPEMGFFSDGVSEDILGRILRGSNLKVIGRTSSFQFRGPDKPKAATALNATHVLDGSIRRAGGKVRIAAHLTEAHGQTTLWSDKYDRDLEDIFAVQDEISEAIAKALQEAFFPTVTAPIEPSLYDLYLRTSERMFTTEGHQAQIAMLETVTSRAPAFSPAWGRLAYKLTQVRTFQPYGDRTVLTQAIKTALARCDALDPHNVEALLARPFLVDPFGAFDQWPAILEGLEVFGSKYATAQGQLSYLLECVGRNRDAIEAARRGRELDPRNEISSSAYGIALWRGGRYAEGVALMETALDAWPDNHHLATVLVLAYAHAKDWDAVDRMIDPARLARYPLREHQRGVLNLLGVLRDPTTANREAIFEAVRAQVRRTGHADPTPIASMADLGFLEESFDLLDEVKLGPSGDRADVLGPNAYRPHVLFQAARTKLRSSPRFVKLCARLGLIEYWLATEQWPDCADDVSYDFRAECEAHRNTPKDVFFE